MKNTIYKAISSVGWNKVFEILVRKGGELGICVLLAIVFVVQATAADFQVQPTTLDLSSKVKSGVFSVINNGNEKIDFQVSVKEWNQDEKGKDIYADTKEIIFFPKVMTVDPNSQRAIRIGLKTPPSSKEKTYRLFVEEIPVQKKAEEVDTKKNIKAGLTIAFRFSMPIFVKPLRPQEVCNIDKVEMSNGTVKAIVKNTGNVHVKLRTMKFSGKAVDGKELYTKEIAGWYILNGLSSSYEAEVPKDVCGKLAKIEVNAQTENDNIKGILNVQKNMCAQ
jgi:fimbrial chaperone protein